MKVKCKLNQIKITIQNAKCNSKMCLQFFFYVSVFSLDLGITTDQSICG